jgi:long-subunit acyl-CoA synthetase (AMP-forming)
VQRIVDEVNQNLARFEKIRKFVLAKSDFSVESGELTPSFKKKRKVIEQRYRQEIDALYAEQAQYAAVR